MINMAFQNLVFGILIGSLYGLAAVGLSLVFGVTKFLNVAHGELIMLGGYACFWAFELINLDPFLSLPLTILCLLVFGVLIYKVLFVRFVKMNEEMKIRNTMLIGFGLSLILQNLALRFWTADDRAVTPLYSGTTFSILDVRFPLIRVISLVIALIAVIALQQFLHRSIIGKAIQATVEDWEAASLMGIDVKKMYLIAFTIGAVLAGIAGSLMSVCYSISPYIGLDWTLKSLIVMVLGGIGNFVGTFIGGIILGATESLSTLVIPGAYREIVGLLLFLLVLIFKPQGLFGQKGSK